MKKEQRLTRPREFSSVYRKGTSRSSNLLVIRALPNGLSVSRFGFSVSKRVGGAVVRNKMKRRLREILSKTPVLSSRDIVFIVRPPAAAVGFSILKQAVEGLLSRQGLIQNPPPQTPEKT
jgi:ribonuclease P protein component